MTKKISWGIVGTGHAKEFAKALQALPEARIVAVTSRFQERAEAFGQEFNVPYCYSDVEALAQNPEVDVVYIGSMPSLHAPHALECLRHGKSILIEKPFTLNAAEAEEIYALAAQKKLFCMEALWSRFLPATRQIAAWLEEGQIGEVRQVIADFGFRTEYAPDKRHFDPKSGGGCLLDVGVYSLAFTAMALGSVPEKISAQAQLCPTGVDEQTAIVLKYPGGALALLSCANRTQSPHRAAIIGTSGRIEVNGFVWAHGATLFRENEKPLVIEPMLPLPAYSYEAAETMRCMGLGLLESPLLPAEEILGRMRCMDEIRRQIGVSYPSEQSQ
ncbi:MAG TPA: Gfo/Idh/MocA family oxidoreductase [Abditibacterium sp.]|jgi:predicted dehydrogenase